MFLFLKELWHLIHAAPTLTERSIMLIVLGLIDVVMISNLLVMVIVGGYETFIEAGTIGGVPLCGTVAGIDAARALASAGSASKGCTTVTAAGVTWQTIIHSVFILSAPGIARTDRIMSQGIKSSAQH